MKKFLLLFILSGFILINTSNASHMKGGEITWECQGNGQYVFYLKLYENCTLASGGSQQLISTGGGVSIIPLFQIGNNDLTPPGCGFSCNNPGSFTGVMNEYIFKSNLITLTGTPPPTGWTFYWAFECCKSASGNVTGGALMVLRSVMYPNNGLSTDPCYDSSPRFINHPVSFICPGYPFSYNAMCVDNDFDSLTYAFDYPYSSDTTGVYFAMTFQFPYSVSSPMPGNPLVNPITGVFTVFPTGATQGVFAICTRTDSYRCGIKTASVFREFQIILSPSGCDGGCDGTGNNQNDPPQITPAPFKNPVTGFYTENSDTIFVGDTVSFTLNVTEFENHVLGCGTAAQTPQLFWIEAFGAEIDSGSFAPYINCDQPPCAYLDLNTPAGPFQIGKQIHFTWITDCAHAANKCSEYTPYFFVINAKDDACPAPAVNNTTFEVVIRGLHIIANGDTLSVNTPFTNLQWFLNGNLIPGATDDTLITVNSGGIYTVQALAPSGYLCESNGVNIVHVGNNLLSTSLNNLTLYPNPVAGTLHVEIKSQVAETAQLKITDGLGREVKQELLQLHNGNNALTVKTNGFQNGIYYLLITAKQNNYRSKFLVMK